MAPLRMQRPLRMTSQISYNLFKHTMLSSQLTVWVNQLDHLCGPNARSGKFAPANCSRTQLGFGFGSAFIRAFKTTNLWSSSIGHPCNGTWSVRGPEENGPSKRTAGCHLPEVPNELVSHQFTHTRKPNNNITLIT